MIRPTCIAYMCVRSRCASASRRTPTWASSVTAYSRCIATLTVVYANSPCRGPTSRTLSAMHGSPVICYSPARSTVGWSSWTRLNTGANTPSSLKPSLTPGPFLTLLRFLPELKLLKKIRSFTILFCAWISNMDVWARGCSFLQSRANIFSANR